MGGDAGRRLAHDPGMADDLATLTFDYWRAVERVRRMQVPRSEKLTVLADLEVIYRQERAAIEAATSALASNARARTRPDRSRDS